MSRIDENNFRECARKAIEKYEENGKLIDALLWNHIVSLYEDALAAGERNVAHVMGELKKAKVQR